MSNLQRSPKAATCKRPKMQHFKMGLQEKYRSTKRIDASTNQLIIGLNGKPFYALVERIYTHSDGFLTGNITYQGKVYRVKSTRLKDNTLLWRIAE